MENNEIKELISLSDPDLKNVIYDEYNNLIDIIIKKYAGVISKLQIDEDEIRCEASFGFSDGINSYKENKDASLKTFLSICIERRVTNYITKCSTKKARMIASAVSLNIINDDSNTEWIDSISDNNKFEPLSALEQKETYNEVINLAKKNLSDFEYLVFTYMVNEIGYQDIAKILDKSPKQIDNTIQRVKLKLRNIIGNN